MYPCTADTLESVLYPDPTSVLRPRHNKNEERITIYDTSENKVYLESLRLSLLKKYKLKADMSEVVRAAIDFLLADFHLNMDDSWIVRRLQAQK